LPGPQDGGTLRNLVRGFGGHVTLYRASAKPHESPFHPLSAGMLSVHKRLKTAFDPHGIFNRGRLYPDL
jgi:glycolate oxidase FAD binding subunit